MLYRDTEDISDSVPIACKLPLEARQERSTEVAALFAAAEQTEALADGQAFRFPGTQDWCARLVEFITFERECCPFFTFELEFLPESGPIWLRIRGPGASVSLLAPASDNPTDGHPASEP